MGLFAINYADIKWLGAEIEKSPFGDPAIKIAFDIKGLNYNARISIKPDAMKKIGYEPVKHGRWIAQTDYPGTYAKCSECGCRCRGYVPNYHYCPDCGAKMDGGADNG